MSIGYFERLKQHIPELGERDVPIFLGKSRELTETSGALLAAAEIVGTTLGRVSLSTLVDEVGRIVSARGEESGLIIEDEDGLGSVRVAADVTTIALRRRGLTEVPTQLMFDMLYVWASYEEGQPDK